MDVECSNYHSNRWLLPYFGSHPQTQDKVAKHSKSAASLLKKAVKAVNDADRLATAAAIQEAQKAVDKLAESSKKKRYKNS